MPSSERRLFNSDEIGRWLEEAATYTPVYVEMPDYLKNGLVTYSNNGDYNKIKKMEKQIDRMAEFINKMDVDEEICSKVKLGICEQYNNGNCKECIKKFFEEE